MPLMSNPDKYGDMIIEFDVDYPNRLDSDQKEAIKEALVHTQIHKKQYQQQNQYRKKVVTDEE